MNKETLDMIIEKHKKWVQNEEGGERANLCGANLRYVDLSGVNLSGAHLCGVDLSDTNLCGVNLSGADLRDANLCGANLCGADLCDTDLRNTSLCGVNLCDADLDYADMTCTNLCDTDLCKVKNFPFIPMTCPDSGSFTAWKKANGYIVKLLVPEDARRSSSTGRKCRCDKAIVIAIETVDGEPSGLNRIASNFNSDFIYKVGETVTEPNFCEDRFNECAPGIHFFVNRQEAVDYTNW